VKGAGEVWTTNHTNLVVKLSNSYTNRALLINHVQQVQNVMRLPLRDLKIALPLSLLQSENGGYVMELMDGLESLSTQIENIQKNGQQLDMFLYRDTGSFGRRLQILKQLAETLAKLHGRGLAFGDLSPNNIFVSQSVEHHQVWLIDADNIHPIEQFNQHHFYTKRLCSS
jgi:serine/threonine protein kinase